MEMILKPHQVWFHNPQQLVTRITNIIGPTSLIPPFKDPRNNGKWTLNASGNWLLAILPDTIKIECKEPLTNEQWNALKTVFEFFLG